jgi:hypothetical protein
MSASPWRTVDCPDPKGDVVALLSYLPLKSYWRVLPFLLDTAQVMRLFASARGLVGYSLLARPLLKRFWTLSAWESADALRAFVQHPPHVRIMAALTPHMNKTRFVRSTVKGSQLPFRGMTRCVDLRITGPVEGGLAGCARGGRKCLLRAVCRTQAQGNMERDTAKNQFLERFAARTISGV